MATAVEKEIHYDDIGIKDDEEAIMSDEDVITSHEKRWYALNKSRGVTLSMLMSDGMIQPGKRCLSIDYLGRQFVADLLENGKIKTHDNVYNTPSAWAQHCKRIVKPEKKSGCGWASVKYKGMKLDTWKSIWCGKQRPHSPYNNNNNNRLSPASILGENGHSENGSRVSTPKGLDDFKSDIKFDSPRSTSSPLTTCNGGSPSTKKPYNNVYSEDIQEEALNLCLHNSDENKNVIHHPRYKSFSFDKNGCKPSVKYESIGKRGIDVDPNTLVVCESFTKYGKQQPFTVSITSNALLLMDYHSHLTHSEIVGYMGGKWDQKTQNMSITEIYPCRCRLGDKDRAPIIEEEIRRSMYQSGLTLVGWYHSHPHSAADPSLKDIGCQMMYQLKMKGNGNNYHPCIGFIVAPYDIKKDKDISTVQAYWVMPPPENRPCDYGIPMFMQYSIHQNMSLSEELLTDMKKLVQFYQGSEDLVKFRDEWNYKSSYLHKIQASLAVRLPADQTENNSLLDFVKDLLINLK